MNSTSERNVALDEPGLVWKSLERPCDDASANFQKLRGKWTTERRTSPRPSLQGGAARRGEKLFRKMTTRQVLHPALPGEMRMKDFVSAEAARRGICGPVVNRSIAEGRYPGLVLRRVNKRVVFVSGDFTYHRPVKKKFGQDDRMKTGCQEGDNPVNPVNPVKEMEAA